MELLYNLFDLIFISKLILILLVMTKKIENNLQLALLRKLLCLSNGTYYIKT